MSSLRRTQSSRANGALSKGPVTPEGKLHSSQNAIIHGLLADCIVLEEESRENFLALLQQHVDHFQPANEVEFGMIEEMCAARWRQRRAWAIETRLFDTQIARPPDGDSLDRMAGAIDFMAAAPSLSLVHRYETRLHIMYGRALKNLITLRKIKVPNEPSPISEHSPVPPSIPPEAVPTAPLNAGQATDSESLDSACSPPPEPVHEPSTDDPLTAAPIPAANPAPSVTARGKLYGAATPPEPAPTEPNGWPFVPCGKMVIQ